jgi:predicted dehydrogenase
MIKNFFTLLFIMFSTIAFAQQKTVNFITLDPGHFHAALVQNKTYENVDSEVKVYAPAGQDLEDHLKRIESYNTRPNNPTHWKENVYRGNDFFEKMIVENKSKSSQNNVLILAGNNQKKTEYILKAAQAGINILGDKPMCIDAKGYELLKKAFVEAQKNNILLYDIMTERSEITSVLQKELSHIPAIFGNLEKGTTENPAIVTESIHYFYKYVSGSPLKRPTWFMDVSQQGEGIADVMVHLVDLAHWINFPNITLTNNDIKLTSAKRWPTTMTLSQFSTITGVNQFPEFLKKDLKNDTTLNVFANGEINYSLKGVHTKLRALWNYSTTEGGDTHYSLIKGTKSNLEIRQGKAENFVPQLYIKPNNLSDNELVSAFEKLKTKYDGIALKKQGNEWLVEIPVKFRTGHEAHFGEVMERFLQYQTENKLPAWEVPNMLVKYYITTKALEMAKSSK